MDKCQQMLFMQLMGFEMNRDMCDDEVKQSLMQALQGKDVLMVLDDAWEVAHCDQLAFLDDSSQSKLLVSSRVKGVLEGGSIVDLNLPSDYDAQKMLLNEAGLVADPSDAPPELAEVTKFCNNLPLAVGMASENRGSCLSPPTRNGGCSTTTQPISVPWQLSALVNRVALIC